MISLQIKTTVLGYDNAYHLLRRTCYKINKKIIEEFAQKTPQEALNDLFTNQEPITPSPLNKVGQTFIPTVNFPNVESNSGFNTNILNWWYSNCLIAPTIHNKLTLFLHTIFVADNTLSSPSSFDYLELLRFHTNGSLKDLALRMSKNIRMLYYLDNYLNNKNHPNQNYAREFLELFTIGKGEQISGGVYTNYSESDVLEASKVFTGFTGVLDFLDPKTRLNTYNSQTQIPEGYIDVSAHDTSDKTFSSAFNNTVISGGNTKEEIEQELNDFVSMVFNQIATAEKFARRIYRFFVSRNISDDIQKDIITPLAQNLFNNNYNLQLAVTQLLTSKHFYDEEDDMNGDNIIGALVKSPHELIMQLYTIFEIDLPDYNVKNAVSFFFFGRNKIRNLSIACGFDFLSPINVNGYSPYKDYPYDKLWITASNLKPRYDIIIDPLLEGFTYNGHKIYLDSVNFVRNSGHFSQPSNSEVLLQEFFKLLFVKVPSGNRYTYYENALLGNLSPINWSIEWDNYINTNIPGDVAIGLDNLIKALIKSAEYQVM